MCDVAGRAPHRFGARHGFQCVKNMSDRQVAWFYHMSGPMPRCSASPAASESYCKVFTASLGLASAPVAAVSARRQNRVFL